MIPVNYDDLSWQERRRVREEYVKYQNNLCYFCKKSLDSSPTHDKIIDWKLFPKNFLKYPVHLHHDHNTGMTIGAVHSYCNAVLWQYYGE